MPRQRNMDEIGYNSTHIRDIPEIFAYNRVFRGQTVKWCKSDFTTTDPDCHGPKFETKRAI